MHRNWLLACVIAIAPSLACAQETGADTPPMVDPCAEADASMPQGARLDLFDPDAPADRRQAALAAYQRVATLEACPHFGYALGLLYRHGPYLPGNLLPQDLPKARALIEPMAIAGDLTAFADMAEMEMRHANAREAMLWTQLYLHYVKTVARDFARDADHRRFMDSAYNSNLLARTEMVWSWARPKLSRDLIREDLNAWLAAHRGVAARMRERMRDSHARVSGGGAPGLTVKSTPDSCYVTLPSGIGAISATWLLEVLPSGEVGRVVLENFVPKAGLAWQMRHCLADYQFNPFPGTEPQTARVPMVVGSPEGRSLRRR